MTGHRTITDNTCYGCLYDANHCHCNADDLDREFDLQGGVYR